MAYLENRRFKTLVAHFVREKWITTGYLLRAFKINDFSIQKKTLHPLMNLNCSKCKKTTSAFYVVQLKSILYGKNKTNYLINKNELPTAFILKEVRISFCFVVADWRSASVNFTHVLSECGS